MSWIAIRMLFGDPVKFLGILFGITFSTLLMSQQVAIFVGILTRTASQILDVRDADIWVMDRFTRFIDEAPGLPDQDLYRVRSIQGVGSAVKLSYGQVPARLDHGGFRTVLLLGLDDPTLTGAPTRFFMGDVESLRLPDAVVLDKAGYTYLFPNEDFQLWREFEINERRAVLVGIAETSPPFTTLPVAFTRYSLAEKYNPGGRNKMTYILARPAQGVSVGEVCKNIEDETSDSSRPLIALARKDFAWKTVQYFLKSTGIPVNFGITIALGFLVGVAIAGQTFYLFTLENIRQFGALKAMGVDNLRLVGMIMLQAFVVGFSGYGIGIGLTALFFESTSGVVALSGLGLFPELLVLVGVAEAVIVTLSSLLSIRKVLILEPAMVFR